MDAQEKPRASAYQLSDGWAVGIIGPVCVGNGRWVLGYQKEIRCFDQATAEQYVAAFNAKN